MCYVTMPGKTYPGRSSQHRHLELKIPRFTLVISILLATPLIVIAVLALVLALVLENPETYRDQITRSIKASTGYDLTIGGQLSWRYWPPIALNIRDLAIKMPGDDSPLASLERASIDLNLLPLLTGAQTISVQGLSLHGLMLHPVIDKKGRANWPQPDETAATRAAIMASDSGGGIEKSSPLFAFNIDGIEITDVTLNYLNEATGEHYILEISSLLTGPLQLGKPVTLEIEAQARDMVNEIRTITSIRGAITFDENLDKLSFKDLSVSNQVHLPDMDPVVITMTFDGGLDIAKNSLQLQLNGTLDDSAIKGSLELNYAETTRLAFDLTLDAINISHYLKSDGEAGTSPHASDGDPNAAIGAAQPPEDSILIPAAHLSAYDVQGRLRVDVLDYDIYTFSDLDLNLRNDNGKFHAEATLNGYDGHLSVEVDASWKKEVQTTLSIMLKQMDMSKLTDFAWITGELNVNSELSFQGTMLSDAMETLDGTNQFRIENGTLDITPLKQLAKTIDSLRGKQSSISEWPNKMPFEQLKGLHEIRHGTRGNQSIDFMFENIRIIGKGGFDYFANHLQYDITIKLSAAEDSTYKVSPALAKFQWPLHCEGAMDASPVDLCFPDRKSIETLVKDIAQQELQRKGRKELDRIIDKGKLKNLLKGLFKR